MPVIYPPTWRGHLDSSSVLITTFTVTFIFINDHIRQLTAFSTHDCDRSFKIMLFERGGNHNVACDLGVVVVSLSFYLLWDLSRRSDGHKVIWMKQTTRGKSTVMHTHIKGNCLEFYLFMLVFYHSWHLVSMKTFICPPIFSSSSSGLWGCWSLLLHMGKRYTCQCITGPTDTDEHFHTHSQLTSVQSFNFTCHVLGPGEETGARGGNHCTHWNNVQLLAVRRLGNRWAAVPP